MVNIPTDDPSEQSQRLPFDKHVCSHVILRTLSWSLGLEGPGYSHFHTGHQAEVSWCILSLIQSADNFPCEYGTPTTIGQPHWGRGRWVRRQERNRQQWKQTMAVDSNAANQRQVKHDGEGLLFHLRGSGMIRSMR